MPEKLQAFRFSFDTISDIVALKIEKLHATDILLTKPAIM
jgi:hypothetical protein